MLYRSSRVKDRVVVEIVGIQSKGNRVEVLRLWCERRWLAGVVESVIVERCFVCGALGRNAAVRDWWYLRRCFRPSFRGL